MTQLQSIISWSIKKNWGKAIVPFSMSEPILFFNFFWNTWVTRGGFSLFNSIQIQFFPFWWTVKMLKNYFFFLFYFPPKWFKEKKNGTWILIFFSYLQIIYIQKKWLWLVFLFFFDFFLKLWKREKIAEKEKENKRRSGGIFSISLKWFPLILMNSIAQGSQTQTGFQSALSQSRSGGRRSQSERHDFFGGSGGGGVWISRHRRLDFFIFAI